MATVWGHLEAHATQEEYKDTNNKAILMFWWTRKADGWAPGALWGLHLDICGPVPVLYFKAHHSTYNMITKQ